MLVTFVAALACAMPSQIAQDQPTYQFEPVSVLDPFGFSDLEVGLVDITPAGDGGAFLAGSAQVGASVDPDVLLIRLDGTGSIQWLRNDNLTMSRPIAVVPDDAGGAYLISVRGQLSTLSAVSVSQYAADGSLIGVRVLDTSPFPAPAQSIFAEPRCAMPDGNGGLYVGLTILPTSGSGTQSAAQLVHLPSISGALEVSSPFAPEVTAIRRLERTADGGFVAVLNRDALVTSVARLDANLQQLWEADISNGPTFAIATGFAAAPDGSVYLGLSSVISQMGELRKLNGADGSPIWTETLMEPTSVREVQDLVALPDGGVLMAGSRGFSTARQPYLQRFDAQGSIVLDQVFETPGERGQFVRLVADGDDWIARRVFNRTTPSGVETGSTVVRFGGLAEVGQAYCGPAVPNSSGLPGETRAFGSAIAADNGLVLRSSQLPVGVFGLYVLGSDQGLMPIPGGSAGRLCVAGTLGRVVGSIGETGLDGTASYLLDLSALPTSAGTVSAMAGDQWNFQYWHRDDPAVSSSNATDAVSVTLN